MIGLFDSGIGGTSIWKEIVKVLPNESTLLLTDSLNAPYGTKSKEQIVSLCEKNTEFLLGQNCSAIVVACNTATTNAIAHLREKYKVPFIGIEPAIKPATLHSQTKVIGVLATKGTLSSELFHKSRKQFGKSQGIKIVEQIGSGLVELIENGQMQSQEMYLLLEKFLLPMVQQNIDHLVLGCTHYPYLIPMIRQILPPEIVIIDAGRAVALQTKNILEKHHLLENKDVPQHQWITNKDLSTLLFFAPKDISVDIKKMDF